MVDTTVGLNYVKAWNMRPRDKKKEIGPRFRFNHKIQMERLHHDLQHEVKQQFERNQLASGDTVAQMQKIVRDGEAALVNKEAFMKAIYPSSVRDSKLGNLVFHQPKDLMPTIHQKTLFKAAMTVKTGQMQGAALHIDAEMNDP